MSSGQEPSGGTGTREVRGAREPSLDASPGQSFDTGRIGYHPEYSAVARALRALRQMLDTLWFEAITIIMVLVYAVILFVSLTVANSTDVDDPLCFAINTTSARREILDTNTTLAELCMITEDQDTLWWLDAIFIHLFEVEICLRALGYGYRICCDPLQAIDSVVVTASFIVLYIPSDAMAAGGNLLNLLRVIRLLRLAVIINRLHNARAAAGMRSKRAMYRRLGAPVEKVLAFLTDFRERMRSQRDQYNIDWMMEVIAGDELYAVADFDEDALQANFGAAAGAGDMSRYLSSETGLAKRRAGSFDQGSDGEGAGEGDSFAKGEATAAGRKLSASSVQLWAGSAISSSGLQTKLQRLVSPEAWSFDIFEYEIACSALPEPATGKAATLLCYYLLEQHGVLDACSIDRAKMLGWLSRVEEGYLRTNPYHNALHAADVCANVDYFIRQPNLQRHLSAVDKLAALIAALIHDMGHPGVNNTFLETTKNELAITYNDVSVLENHHVAAAFKLLKTEGLDWTKEMGLDEYKDMRETVIGMVLGTDMRAHFEHLTRFKSKIAGEGFKEHIERKDSRLLLTMALHAADIANPSKPQAIATAWARRSMEEFFRQGDREMELGLPISPFMDRSKVPLGATIVNCQIGFINVLVRPLLSEWAAFLGAEAERDIVVQLEATLRLWETSGAKVIDSWGDFAGKKEATAGTEMSVMLGGKKDGKGKDANRKTEGVGSASSRNLQQKV